MRLFLGFEVPADWREKLAEFVAKLPAEVELIAVENWHLSLYFLGEVEEMQLENLKNLCQYLFKNEKELLLSPQKWALAPDAKQPRMVWLQFQKHPTFTSWVQRMEKAWQQISPKQNTRKSPVPHITLARIEDVPIELPTGALPNAGFPLRAIVCWESLREGEGIVYREVFRVGLKRSCS